jgi:DNA-binding NarL/FixJ family response regulator
MKELTLPVISDEAIPRLGAKHLLSSEANFAVKGEAERRRGQQQRCDPERDKLRPDVAVVFAEAKLPSCPRLVSSIRTVVPGTAIVVLGRETHDAYLGLLLAAETLEYLLPGAKAIELLVLPTPSRGVDLSILIVPARSSATLQQRRPLLYKHISYVSCPS